MHDLFWGDFVEDSRTTSGIGEKRGELRRKEEREREVKTRGEKKREEKKRRKESREEKRVKMRQIQNSNL